MRASKTAFVVLACLVVLTPAQSQGFGRFGYNKLGNLPGLEVDSTGFKVKHDFADRFTFAKPSSLFRNVQTTALEQTIQLVGGENQPAKIRYSLLSNSLDLYFPKGFSLKLHTAGAPYLSWSQGTVANGVPTPDLPWCLLSFQSPQPPIVLGFAGKKASLMVTGKAGNWSLDSKKYTGWVRVMLPTGTEAEVANTASSLGKLAKRAQKFSDIWSAPAPTILKQETIPDDLGITVTWTYSGPGAMVPPASRLAELGGYPMRVLSPFRALAATTEKLPVEYAVGNRLSMRFPTRRAQPGRALGVGPYTTTPIGSASPIDPPSVSELALECLLSRADNATLKQADDTVTEYLSQATYKKEPNTEQILPFDADGVGLDVLSAESLLQQALLLGRGSQEANALLTSSLQRFDPWTWTLWAKDPTIKRRSASLTALAAALSQDPSVRLSGAMLQAGLAAEKGAEIKAKRLGEPSHLETLIEPLYSVRQGFYALAAIEAKDDAYSVLLGSPLRVQTNTSLALSAAKDSYSLEWSALEAKPSQLNLVLPKGFELEPLLNLPRFEFSLIGTVVELAYTPESLGLCRVKLKVPAQPALPRSADPPRYSETPR